MVNKKGIIKIIESIIASLIVISVLLIIANSKQRPSYHFSVEEQLPPILEEIAQNESLRKRIIVEYDTTYGPYVNDPSKSIYNKGIREEIEARVGLRLHNTAFNYTARICELNSSICALESIPKDVRDDIYSAERVISASTWQTASKPKRLKLFVWAHSA